MNERIKELAEQASHQSPDGYPVTIPYSKDFVEKFAELIVGECCAILNEMHLWQTMNNQEYSSTWHDAVDQGIDQLKEHFGVEE
jgi:hypothetical protein